MEYYEKNIGTTEEGEPIIKFIPIPEITEDEYVAQVKNTYGNDVSNAEALELLHADVALDDHLDTALELE